MFRQRQAAEEGAGARDEHLNALLREWKDLTPRASFEADVWRRIRCETALEPGGFAFADILRQWLPPHPVWTSAVAATVAVAFGVWAGLSAPAIREGRLTTEPLLHSRTLAGAYAAMATGQTP